MRTPRTKQHASTFSMENTYETESQIQKLRRIVENKEPIKDEAPIIYTPKSKGVMPEYDIRTDRFEVAREALEKAGRAEAQRVAKGLEPQLEKSQAEQTTKAEQPDGIGQ
nr:MAG TPA: hypothetical protein [Microviridae sp.]